MAGKFFNPLTDVNEDKEDLQSESSSTGRSVVNNESYGLCSVCSKQMEVAKNALKENVFWCDTCKCSMPCRSDN